jgi:riboflavin kinase/FMN adenylyltransferase
MLNTSTILKNKIKEIAIGRFDGMHLGHQKIFEQLDKNNGAILVIDIGYANLTPHIYKKNFTNLPIIFVKLEEIKDFKAEEFIKDFLEKEFLNLEKIVVGYDFAFGKNRLGDTKSLKRIFSKKVTIVEEVKKNNISIHSKEIRHLIKDSKIEIANSLLGYNYAIIGEHINGQGLGKKELFPTINIKNQDFLIPADGVYKTNTICDNKTYKSISFIGNRATTDNNFSIETHLIDIEFESTKIKEVKIEFIKKLRENKKFKTIKELKKQIKEDIKECEK